MGRLNFPAVTGGNFSIFFFFFLLCRQQIHFASSEGYTERLSPKAIALAQSSQGAHKILF